MEMAVGFINYRCDTSFFLHFKHAGHQPNRGGNHYAYSII